MSSVLSAGPAGTNPKPNGAGGIRAPQPGDTLGEFRLIEKLGDGGMASIYRAEHTAMGAQLAVKVLHPDMCQRPDIVHRFFKEVQAIQRTNHPNIREVGDLVQMEGLPPFTVMELLEGEDLAVFIERSAPFSPAVSVEIALQICSALHAIHARSLVHRDLKPENIFLVGGGDDHPIIKLLDFGLVKFIHEDDPFLRTLTGEQLGTPHYMPPEQIRGEQLDGRADIFSVGVLLYVMLTGMLPLDSEDVAELFELMLEKDPDPPSTHAETAGIPPLLDEIVLRCMQKEPERRVQSAAQLARLLQASLDPHTQVTLPPLPRRRRRSERDWGWLAGAALAAAALGGGVLLALRFFGG